MAAGGEPLLLVQQAVEALAELLGGAGENGGEGQGRQAGRQAEGAGRAAHLEASEAFARPPARRSSPGVSLRS